MTGRSPQQPHDLRSVAAQQHDASPGAIRSAAAGRWPAAGSAVGVAGVVVLLAVCCVTADLPRAASAANLPLRTDFSQLVRAWQVLTRGCRDADQAVLRAGDRSTDACIALHLPGLDQLPNGPGPASPHSVAP